MRRHLFIFVSIVTIACGKRHEPALAPYLPLAEAEATYGRLIAAGNHPTSYQSGTGERLGLFEDASGIVWGLPLAVASDGAVLVCAAPSVREAAVTDSIPAGEMVVGATNEPTGWRGGTGRLELLLRDTRGTIRWRAVRGASLVSGPVCSATEGRTPLQHAHYFKLAPTAGLAQ